MKIFIAMWRKNNRHSLFLCSYMLEFQLLQIAIGAKAASLDSLTASDWWRFYDFCKRQALLGIGFCVVEELHEQGICCPKDLMMRWMTAALQIERRNELLNEQCRTLTECYEHDGLLCCILKGQGNLFNYPEAIRNRRMPGDIDLWAVASDGSISIAVQTEHNKAENIIYRGRKAVVEYVRMQHLLAGNCKPQELRYHHIDAPLCAGVTSVEVHFRVGFCRSPLRNRRMQRWFDRHTDECMENKTATGFSVPTPSVNIVYQMTHLFTHYFDEGVGLRQLLDYYYALITWHDEYVKYIKQSVQETSVHRVLSAEEIHCVLASFGMARFAAAVMWVLQRVFAMSDTLLICMPDSKRGKQLLYEIMQAGNFGQYDERGKKLKEKSRAAHAVWKHNRIMRLICNYPEEALCEPLFRLWHWGWRCMH